MKKIEKTISRDLALVDIYAWHVGYTSGMKDWFGWSYSDAVFYVHDGYTDIMRPPEEHLQDFRQQIIVHIQADPAWFEREQKNFLALADEMLAFYETINQKLDSLTNAEMVKAYEKYAEYVKKIIGPFIMMLWFPIFLEKEPELSKRYKNELALAVEARKKTETIFPDGAVLLNKLLEKVGQQINLGTELVKFISRDEFLAFLKDGSVPLITELEARQRGYVYGNRGIILTDNSPDQIKSIFASLGFEYEIESYGHIKELKGSSACKGMVKGIVRVIMAKQAISSIQEGEVLVASMTTPEYLPAMKKAAAFVTDEGGITCHAAIVARELNKPCIIGTKIATKVLKDGDMVEVDADKGIVRIIA